MIFLVLCVRSDQRPNNGPDSRPLTLNADRLRPRKYGAASSVCRKRHIVGKITASDNWTDGEQDKKIEREGWGREKCVWWVWQQQVLHWTYVIIYLSVCLFIWFCVSQSECYSVCLVVSLSFFLNWTVCKPVWLSVCQFVLSVAYTVCQSIRLPACLSISLSGISLSISQPDLYGALSNSAC